MIDTRIIEQNTPEWREARATLITASRVSAVIGAGGFKTQNAVMREMVMETLGEFNHSPDSAPMKWGRDNEAVAADQYELLYGGDREVKTTGFWVKGLIGASPDRLVGSDGLVEIKCPWSKRNDKCPEFLNIDEQQHYWHQVQAQLYCTDRKWCDFFQWTPAGFSCETVERNEFWYDTHKQTFENFNARYLKEVADADLGGPQQKLGMSVRWQLAAEQYLDAIGIQIAATTDVKDAKERLSKMVKECELSECSGAGVKVALVERRGSIDYKAMAKQLLEEDALINAESGDEFRKKSTTAVTITKTGE